VAFKDASNDWLLRLADSLREIEIVIGPVARPAVAEVREQFEHAVQRRQSGDVSGALELIRQAMVRLANLGSELDANEGALMRAIADRFGEALALGDKGTAKEAVGLMRRRAGDPKDEEPADW
jgi:hypothetical protein